MRRIDIQSYQATPVGTSVEVEVNPFELIEEVLSSGTFNPKQLLDRMDVLKRFRSQKGNDTLALEEADYTLLKSAMDVITGFNVVHSEFLRRIYYAPQVDIV